MSRIRTIKPEFWTSEQVVECSIPARLLFIGIWNFADDQGVIPASAKQLKMQILPGDDFSVAQVLAMVHELIAQGLVAEFKEEHKKYWWVTGWARHQKIDRPNPKYPVPRFDESSTNAKQGHGSKFDEDSTNDRRALVDNSASCSRGFDEHSPPEGKGRESISGTERKGREGSLLAHDCAETGTPTYPHEFEEAWKLYPERTGGNSKAAAYRAWKARIREGASVEELTMGTKRYADYCDANGKTGTQFVKQAVTFFGPDRHYKEAWAAQKNGKAIPELSEKGRQTKANLDQWLAKSTARETH